MDQRHSDYPIDPFENFTNYLYRRVDTMLRSLPADLENLARERKRRINSEMILSALNDHLSQPRSTPPTDEVVTAPIRDNPDASEQIDDSRAETPVEDFPAGFREGDNLEADGYEIASLLAAFYRGGGEAFDVLVGILKNDLVKFFKRRLHGDIDLDNIDDAEGLALLVLAKLYHAQIDLSGADSVKHRNARVYAWVYRTAYTCLADHHRKQEPYKVYLTSSLSAGALASKNWTLTFAAPASMEETTVEFSIAEPSVANLRRSIEAIQACILYYPPIGDGRLVEQGLGPETPFVKFFVNGREMLAVPKGRTAVPVGHLGRSPNPVKTAFKVGSPSSALWFETYHKGELELRDSLGRSYLRVASQKPERFSTVQARRQDEDTAPEEAWPDPRDPAKAHDNLAVLRIVYDELLIGLDGLLADRRTGVLFLSSLALSGERASSILKTGLPSGETWPSHNIVRKWNDEGLAELVTRGLFERQVREPKHRRNGIENGLKELGDIVWSCREKRSKESGHNG